MQPETQISTKFSQLSTHKRNLQSFGLITKISAMGRRVMLMIQPWQVLCTCRHQMTYSMQLDTQITTNFLQLSTDKRNVQNFGLITKMSPIGSRFMLVMQP